MISSSSQKESCVPTFKLQLSFLHFLEFGSKFQRFSHLNRAAPRAPGRPLVRALPEAARGRHVAGERRRAAQAGQAVAVAPPFPRAHASVLCPVNPPVAPRPVASPRCTPSCRAELRHWPAVHALRRAPPREILPHNAPTTTAPYLPRPRHNLPRSFLFTPRAPPELPEQSWRLRRLERAQPCPERPQLAPTRPKASPRHPGSFP